MRASVLFTARTRYGGACRSATGTAAITDPPFGSHCGARYARAVNGSPTGVRASRSASQTTTRPPDESSRMKASRRPSGDQTGNELCVVPVVNARGAPGWSPASVCTTTWPVGRGSWMFHSSAMSVRTYATRRPSDDTATGCPPANVRTASMSSVVKTGAGCANAAGADESRITVASDAMSRCMESSVRGRSELYTKRHARGCAGFVPGHFLHRVPRRSLAGRNVPAVAPSGDPRHHRHAAGGPAGLVRLAARPDAVARRLRPRGDALQRRCEPGAADAAVPRDDPHRPASRASRRSDQRRIPAPGRCADARRVAEGHRLHDGGVHRRLSLARLHLRAVTRIRSLRR